MLRTHLAAIFERCRAARLVAAPLAAGRAMGPVRFAAALLVVVALEASGADPSCDKNHYILGWTCAEAKAGPANHLVGLGDDCATRTLCFYPDRLTIKAGDSVTFFPYDSNDFSGIRNVAADDGSFRCANGCDGEGGNGAPAGPPWQFTRTFNTPGIVAYHDEVSRASAIIEVLDDADASVQAPVAIEYIYRRGDFRNVSSYFVTSFREEIASLDVGGLWWRTGESFNVWTAPASGTLPACRFVDKVYGGHFYTPYPSECVGLKANEGWQYEGTAFHLQVPDASGNCPAGTTTLFRLYNGSRLHPVQPFQSNGTFYTHAPLHRYTTRVELFDQARAEGWEFEGDSRTFAFACVAAPAPPLAR